MTKLELVDNMKNQAWRLNNLYWIIDENGKKVKFRMNRVQLVIFATMWYLNLILKSRQHGITTFICLFFLDTCLFNSNVHAGIIAHNREDAEAFFNDKVAYAFYHLPMSLQERLKPDTENARELRFPNNSSIRVGTSLRSTTLQYLHISEFGKLCAKFPEKAREVVTGALNTVHKGQFIFIESTAEGRSGYFYDYCQKAKELKDRNADLSYLDLKFFFFAWYDDPKNVLDAPVEIPQDKLIYFDELKAKGIELSDQQKAWYCLKAEQQGSDMKREHPSTPEEAFEGSARDCFFSDVVDGHINTVQGLYGRMHKVKDKEYEFAPDARGIVELWKYPYFLVESWDKYQWLRRYTIGSDIGEGLEGDYSIAYVYDRVKKAFVAVMVSNKIDSHRWGDRLHELSLYYQNALIVPERNGAGITTINRLMELKANLYVYTGSGSQGSQVTKHYGWLETKESKQSACGTLKTYLRDKSRVYDKKLIDECSVFVKDEEKEKLGADEGFHDDRVIAAALALQGDLFLSPAEKIIPKKEGWRERLAEERKGSAWAA
jgi:hypothetical protein